MTTPNGGDRRSWPLRALRRAARGLMHLVDRTLHTARRSAARRRIRNLRNPASVLFICHGNICRSPYAEAALRRPGVLRDRNIVVRSAGFVGPGRPSPDEALASAERHGIDLTPHESRLMELGELRETTLVVVMDARQQRAVAARSGRPGSQILVLGDLDPGRIGKRAIRDPWGQPEAVFDRVYDRIDRCVEVLARELNQAAVVPGADEE